MEKKSILNIAVFLLVVLGVVIIYIGISGPKVIFPPVITGLGFFVIGWAIHLLNK